MLQTQMTSHLRVKVKIFLKDYRPYITGLHYLSDLLFLLFI